MRALVASAFAAAAILVRTEASAQNADPFFFGDDAALAGGAVVASGRDSGAFWYNPAGFGGLRRGLVSASASTFGVRLRNVDSALSLRLSGKQTGEDLSSMDIISVPNAVVAATTIGDRFSLAGGLLSERDVRTGFINAPDRVDANTLGGNTTIRQRMDIQSDDARYRFGASGAMEVQPNLRVGVALYGTYAKTTTSLQYALGVENDLTPPTKLHALTITRVTSSAFGFMGAAGAQWDASRDVTLGLTIRSPEVVLTQSNTGGQVSSTSVIGTAEPPISTLATEAPRGGLSAGTLLAPARMLAGLAFALGPPQSFVEVGLDVAHGLRATGLTDAQQPQVNARVGVRYRLSPQWTVGGGLFSDRATRRKPNADGILGERADYYGLTAGVSKRTPLSLTQHPAPEALVLITTVSLRAAIGVGEVRTVLFDFDAPGTDQLKSPIAKVTFIDLLPYIGSAVLF